MNNKLINIIELIRKDTGINNAIDAVEQLALLLLVRYTHEVASNEISKENYIDSFRNLFFDLNDFSKDGLVIDFYALRDKLNHVIVNSRFSENKLSHSVFSRNNWKKIENILDQIPFRVRSKKILGLVIHRLEELDLSEGIEV
ncbi:restriction endonuclease subunit M, partial [Vibrio anguillarum]|nr:restriction endonuclease subunit M [Vibrio anguillarum]